ncbi:phosphatase PAP2 family protein [Streptomyces sp. NPDC021080]|uniref:phosphatase PAP2 family protein n=1 Tax=Streptomyces sp. NPDC021080 TaxID=3365110 RepID=UPI0037AD8C7D
MGSWRRAQAAAVPPALRTFLGLVAALAALVVLVLGILYAGDSTPDALDARLGAEAYDVGQSWRNVALALDFLGEPAGSVALVTALVTGCLLLRRPRTAVLLVAGTATSVGTATLLKSLVGRTIHGDNLSYPSGHTAFATTLALVVALTAAGRPGLGRPAGTSLVLASAVSAGTAMGWAEVALSAHYPTDALGGWCTALAVTPATAWLVDKAADRVTARTAGRRAGGPDDDRPSDPTAGRMTGRMAEAGRGEHR